jgi:hypothetical protein
MEASSIQNYVEIFCHIVERYIFFVLCYEKVERTSSNGFDEKFVMLSQKDDIPVRKDIVFKWNFTCHQGQ